MPPAPKCFDTENEAKEAHNRFKSVMTYRNVAGEKIRRADELIGQGKATIAGLDAILGESKVKTNERNQKDQRSWTITVITYGSAGSIYFDDKSSFKFCFAATEGRVSTVVYDWIPYEFDGKTYGSAIKQYY